MSADGAFEKSLLEKETVSLFSLSADGEFVLSLLKKGKRSTFFFAKKKKVPKKKLATLQVDGLSSVGALYRKAHSTLRESTMLRHCYYSLGERVFRRSWFFEVL